MKKLRAIVITVLAISLMIGVLGSNSLAGTCYLPFISSSPPPPPVTPDQFIGSWELIYVEDPSIGKFLLNIKSDNTFDWFDPGKTVPHFSGTWSITGDTLIGPFTLKDVGEGELFCTIAANGSMNIDFVEHWHDPYKHVPYTATKL
jgi:hypothetical protein